MNICKVPNCYRMVKRGRMCNTCKSRLYRSRHLLESFYRAIKDRAKNRGVPFLLTFEEYVNWGTENNYFSTKGKGPDDFCIDRIKTMDENGNVLGYMIGNIQLLTMSANGLKARGERRNEFFKRQYVPRMPGDPF